MSRLSEAAERHRAGWPLCQLGNLEDASEIQRPIA